MKVLLPILALLLLTVLSPPAVEAQDSHFAQFEAAPLYFNPSLAGLFDGKYRFTANHRSQWASVTRPFLTLTAAAEKKLTNRKYKQRYFGAGLHLLRDQAGDGGYGITRGTFVFSLNTALNRDLSSWLSFGLAAGIGQMSIDFDALSFDDQYNGQYFDPGITSGEVFNRRNYLFPDFGLGISYVNISRNDLIFRAGYAAYHINRPPVTWFSDNSVRLDVRHNIHMAMMVPLQRRRQLEPALLLLKQGQYSEYFAGADYRIILRENQFEYSTISFGLFYRHLDAAVVKVGGDWRDMRLGISYDVNFSGLRPASHYRGGVELSLIYLVKDHSRLIERYPSCPVF